MAGCLNAGAVQKCVSVNLVINVPSFYSVFFCIIYFHYFIFNFGSFLQKTHKCKSCRSRQELSNEYLLAKFGVDIAEAR